MATRLLDYDDLWERGIKYSKCQLWRLEKADRFPQPVRLSATRKCWAEDEIDAWIQARVDGRAL